MKLHLLLLIFISLSFTSVNAQYSKHKRKRSTNAGTIFFYWGNNRTFYSPSSIRFIGTDYDFTLSKVKGQDKQTRNAGDYFNPTRITLPQYNFRLGYYFVQKWAISVGVDHFNYRIKSNSEAVLNGHFGLKADSLWKGNYTDESVILDPAHFYFEHSGALNFIRIELMRSFDIWEAGRKRQFAITGNVGAGLGPVLSKSYLYFNGKQTHGSATAAGYGLGISGAIRLEFFKHVFIQGEGGFSFAHLPSIKTNISDLNQRSKQAFGFANVNLTLGILLYARPKNACDSCPKW